MVGGIENVYHDPCQDWLDLINMKVTSPNYPDAYDPLEYCTWNITAPPGHFVTLDFERIDVSNNSLGMNCPMFANCLVFCDVREVQCSIFGQNEMFKRV